MTKLPFENLRYCVRCCLPETQEGLSFDEFGICLTCQSQEQKIHINWVEREKGLRKILEDAKKRAGNNYDCILPTSGGKDSTFQMYLLTKVYGMKPLAVTFSHNWYSETGFYNLMNSLEEFNVDHIMFTPNRKLVNNIAKCSLGGIGDACWHCHAGIGAFPLQIAVRFKIPLLIWGESVNDYSGRSSHYNPVRKFDREYFTKVSAKLTSHEMVGEDLSERDLHPFDVPSAEECEAIGLHGIHLGDYIFWDEERQTEFVKEKFGWKETQVEGTYKGYKSAECIMPGVHDFACYQKRGYGRSTFHASMDVRNGLLTREEAFDLIKQFDAERPEALDYYLEITGMTEEQFYSTLAQHRQSQLNDVEIPVVPKTKPNKERTIPFVQQLIAKHRGKE